MWLIGSGRQMAALAALAFTVAGAVSCTNNSGNTRDETATAPVGKCASRTHAAASDSGFITLPVSSSESAGYYTARYAWVVSNTCSGDIGGAGQAAYLEVAVADLQLGLGHDSRLPGGRQAYRAAIRDLRQMASLPDTEVTPKQRAEYDTDVTRLSHFFGT